MPTPIDWDTWRRYRRTIEQALRDGYAPPNTLGGRGSAVEEAMRRLRAQGYHLAEGTLTKWRLVQERRQKRGADHELPDWSLYAPAGLAPAEAATGAIKRWLLTAAQDDTDVHPGFWKNLHAYAQYCAAEVVVAGMTYQQVRHTDRLTLTNTYRPEIRDYLRFEPMDCGPVLFAADVNILPTAARPLSGMLTYSKGRDAVFPHTKHAYETVPQMPGEEVPVVMTTGACTVENYIPKKVGKKAQFHHVIGCVVVEVAHDGVAFSRPIAANRDGSFHDLDVKVADGKVTPRQRVEAITWGDIHNPSVPEAVFDAIWGRRVDTMIEVLRPRHQVMHDLLSLDAFARQERENPLHWISMAARGLTGMEQQIASAGGFLQETSRPSTVTVVVESNHDKRLEDWAQKPTDRRDIQNVRFWHECNIALLEAIERGDDRFN
ncbi:MAG: hypothetical protein V2I82_01380, partial [Halieaceae bacterium]|nr:hypothetical protein [Halieaceae bacterium]